MSGSFTATRYETRTSSSSRRSILGFWAPIMVTTTLAAGGLAMWVLNQREEHEATSASSESDLDDDEHLSYGDAHPDHIRPPASASYGASEENMSESMSGAVGPVGAASRADGRQSEENSMVGRVQGILRRTPSPQQMIDGARKGVAAGVAAVGGMVGGALSSIQEDHEGDYEDHQRWRRNEGREGQEGSGDPRPLGASASGSTRAPNGKKRTVAIVVNAEDGDVGPIQEDAWKEDASLLSHISPVNPEAVNLVVLIYSPTQTPLESSGKESNSKVPSSLGSSYGAIPTPGEELASLEPVPVTPALSAKSGTTSHYDALFKEAQQLVPSSENILPFSTIAGFTHMIKHLAPEVVYVSDSLSGKDGSNVAALKGWVGQVVVVIGGDASGLVETEDELNTQSSDKKWWEGSDLIGLGKGVEVVDAIRVGDDWERRVGGKQ